jgi:hypothetical protein
MKSRTTSPLLPEEADILSELSYKINSGALNKGCIHANANANATNEMAKADYALAIFCNRGIRFLNSARLRNFHFMSLLIFCGVHYRDQKYCV